MPSAADYIQRKRVLPSELNTEEYSQLSTWTLELGFMMACVTNAKDLEKNKALAAAILRGEISQAQARESLRRHYEETNYQPPAGMEGTIKDLRTVRRMKATLEMNVAMAQGWKRKEDLRGNIAKPGLEYYRAKAALDPRDWESKWADAYASVGGEGAAKSRMVALHDSPIWLALSEFNRPHPPFDWGSKMGLRPVSLAECVRLGLIPDPKSPEGREQLQKIRDEGKAKRSLNEDVRFDCQISNKEIAQDLEENLQGIAEWDGRTIRLTDVNGSRPYAWDEIGEVITAPNRAGVPLRQAEAFVEFFHNSQAFAPLSNEEIRQGRAFVKRVSRDMTEALTMGARRIKPITSEVGGEVSRGLKMHPSKWRSFLKTVKRQGYGARPGFAVESWTSSPATSQEFSGDGGVVIVAKRYKSRRRVDGLYRHLDMKYKKDTRPEITEGESFFMGETRFRYLRHYQKNGRMYIEVEEDVTYDR